MNLPGFEQPLAGTTLVVAIYRCPVLLLPDRQLLHD